MLKSCSKAISSGWSWKYLRQHFSLPPTLPGYLLPFPPPALSLSLSHTHTHNTLGQEKRRRNNKGYWTLVLRKIEHLLKMHHYHSYHLLGVNIIPEKQNSSSMREGASRLAGWSRCGCCSVPRHRSLLLPNLTSPSCQAPSFPSEGRVILPPIAAWFPLPRRLQRRGPVIITEPTWGLCGTVWAWGVYYPSEWRSSFGRGPWRSQRTVIFGKERRGPAPATKTSCRCGIWRNPEQASLFLAGVRVQTVIVSTGCCH